MKKTPRNVYLINQTIKGPLPTQTLTGMNYEEIKEVTNKQEDTK